MNARTLEEVSAAATAERTYPIAYVGHRKSPIEKRHAITWRALSAGLSKISKGEKDGKGWLPADIALGQRAAERVQAVSVLVLDVEADAQGVLLLDENGQPVKDAKGKNVPVLDEYGDIVKRVTGKAPPSIDEMIAELDLWEWRFILHTSYSHSAEHARYRLLLDLSRPLVAQGAMAENEIKLLAPHVAERLGIAYCVDKSCIEPARFYFTPRAPSDERLALFRHASGGSNPLDVDALLDEAAAVKLSVKQSATPGKAGRTSGVIDAFNDVHDVGAIVEANGYDSAGRDRWIFIGSSSGVPGVRLLPERNGRQMIYSSHTGDPLNDGHAQDAFSAWCILEHAGDTSKAVAAAAKLLGIDAHKAPPVSYEKIVADLTLVEDERLASGAPVDPEPPLIEYPAPFRGVMADTVAAAVSAAVKPQPDLCTLATLVGMAGACSGAYALPSGMRLNLFACGVAGTGEGKDAPRSVATEITRAAGGESLGRPASGQALEDSLPNTGASLLALDEVAHFFGAVNAADAPAHLIELAGVLLQLFSASKGHYRTRTRAVGRGILSARVLHNPMLSLLGFSTPEKLGAAMGVSNIEDGLLGRFLFAFGQEDVIPRRGRAAFALPEKVKQAAEALKEGISTAEFTASLDDKDSITIKIDDEAEAKLCEMLAQFDQQKRKVKNAFSKALLTRSFEKAERVAGVLAVWDCPAAPVMTVEHVEWSEALLIASDAALIRFSTEFMHGGQVQTNAQRIMRLVPRVVGGELKPQKKHEARLLAKGLAPVSMVLRLCKLNKKDFDAALEYLYDLRELQTVEIQSVHPNGRKEKSRGLERM
jgi:hypothetical protein